MCDDGLCVRTNRKTLTRAYYYTLLCTFDKTNGTLSLGVTVNFRDEYFFFIKMTQIIPRLKCYECNIVTNVHNKSISKVAGVTLLHRYTIT